MFHPYAFLILFCLFFGAINAQSPAAFGDRLIVGTSVSYILERDPTIPNTFHEFTWSKNIAVNLNRRFYLGLDFRNLWTQGSAHSFSEQQDHYYMVGAFSQFDFLPNDPIRLFIELSSYYGNYYQPLGPEDPMKRDGLWYLGVGGGLDVPISKRLSFDLAFLLHEVYGEWRETAGYNIYIVGLNYNFGRS